MRKNTPRKWIHAILDLLPLFIIPMFALMVRSDNGWNPISIEVDNRKITYSTENVYKYTTNTVIYNNGILDTSSIIDGNTYTFTFYSGGFNQTSNTLITNFANNFNINGIDIVNMSAWYYAPSQLVRLNFGISSSINGVRYSFSATGSSPTLKLNITCNNYFDNDIFVLKDSGSITGFYYTISALSNSDNTIIGSNIVEHVTGEIVTYDNTDIGSQFLYSVYKPVNEYFNFNNLFNMQGIYDWLQLNLFGGNAPLPVLIVWNIIVYEFFIDLIFLLYSVFMFFIDFATHMIDSFTGRCR